MYQSAVPLKWISGDVSYIRYISIIYGLVIDLYNDQHPVSFGSYTGIAEVRFESHLGLNFTRLSLSWLWFICVRNWNFTHIKIFSPISFKNRAQLITRFNLTDRVISSTMLQALCYYVTPSLLPTHFTPLKSMIVAMLGAAWIIFSYNVTSNCIFSGISEWAHQRVLPNVVRSFPLMSYTW